MKVTNWRRTLAASLVAGGLLSPAIAAAADLNVNLIANPSFEAVDLADTGPFDSVRILQWSDTGLDGATDDDNFAYAYSQNYAGVNTPAGAGDRYFTGGFGTTAGQATISQNINLATGATGTLIPAGEAAFQLSGFFSSYLTQDEGSRLRVRFLDQSANELGFADVGGAAFVASLGTQPGSFGTQRDWGQDITTGFVPSATRSAVVELISDVATGNNDGYTDLVELQIANAADLLLFLEVNTATGATTLKNQTGETVHLDYYEILSPGDSLDATGWNSLQTQNLPGLPAGNGSGNGWEEAGGSDAGVLSESYLTSNSVLGGNASLSLGALYNTAVHAGDLVFRYGAVLGAGAELAADFDGDGATDGGDLLAWQRGFGLSGATAAQGDATGDGIVDSNDFAAWEGEFGTVGGPSGPSTLITGFVRYVASASATAVPEPGAVWLVGIGIAAVGSGRRRKPGRPPE